MNVLAIGVHPDDVEILCAGTLAKYAAAGHKVFIGIATNGDVGSQVMTRDEIKGNTAYRGQERGRRDRGRTSLARPARRVSL